MKATVTQYFTYLIFSVLILLLVSCSTPLNSQSKEQLNDDSVSPRVSENQDVTETDILTACKNAWARYSDESQEGMNWRKFRAGYLRTEVFDRALIAYWEIEDRFPYGENSLDTIETLENRKLIPFWPLDPDSGERMRIVSNPGNIFSYSDIYLETGSSGAFDYVLEYYHNTPPFSPYVGSFEHSARLGNLQRENPVNDGNETFTVSNNPDEAFRRMVGLFFDYMINTSFITLDGRVPETLDELLAGRLAPNPDGWGHPSLYVQDGAIGDFEFGVDPSLNAYYISYISPDGELIETAKQFTMKEIAGELAYDITGPHSLTRTIDPDDLQMKISLLTDELFSGPPPELQ